MSTKPTIKLGPFLQASSKVLTAVKDDGSTDMKTICLGPSQEIEGKPSCPACGQPVESDAVAHGPHAPTPVNQRYRCSACLTEHSSYHPFPRGHDNGDSTFTVVTGEELSGLGATEDEKTTLQLMFCPIEQVARLGVPDGKYYHLVPGDAAGREGFGVIHDTIRAKELEGHACVSVWAYRTAAHTVRITVAGNILGVQQLAEPAKVQLAPEQEIPAYDERFLPLAKQAADLMVCDFNPETFRDTRKERVAALLAEKQAVASGATPTTVAAAPASADSQLAALAAWIDSQSADPVSGAGETPKKKATKRAPAKKAAAKKAPAKKAAAKKLTPVKAA